MTQTNDTSANPPATNPAEINEDALDNVVGGITFTAPGDVAGVKRQRAGDGSVKPSAGQFNSTASGSPNV